MLNDRGLDLSLTDILKAEIIGKIPDYQKETYANKWDDIQEDLGREMFQNLFTHIRMIYKKSKPKESILKEIRQYVLPTANPEEFINEKLCPYANSYSDISKKGYGMRLSLRDRSRMLVSRSHALHGNVVFGAAASLLAKYGGSSPPIRHSQPEAGNENISEAPRTA